MANEEPYVKTPLLQNLETNTVTHFNQESIWSMDDADYRSRMESFKLSPIDQDIKSKVVKAGYQDLGFLGMKCRWCWKGITIDAANRTNADIMLQDHITKAPTCLFTSKFTKDIRHKKFDSLESRLNSFNTNAWTESKIIDLPTKISHTEWATLGFFYSKKIDELICFACDLSPAYLNEEWKSEDVWMHHAYENPWCPFIGVIKGADFISRHRDPFDQRPIRSRMSPNNDYRTDNTITPP